MVKQRRNKKPTNETHQAFQINEINEIEINEINEINEIERKGNERKRNTTGHTTRRAEYSSVKRRDYQAVPSIRR